jgi:hypothetical protein
MKDLFIGRGYTILISIISITSLIWGIYNKIKFLCLKKASEMVAKAEENSQLSGEEKFSLVLLWINNDLPKIFKNSLFQTVVEKIINFAYNTSFEYMKKYIKRKTGKDISSIIDSFKETIENDEE